MTIQEPIKKRGISHKVKCVLCHNDAKEQPKIVKLGSEYGIICNKCGKNFSAQDIELMHNMFTAFGGYFGMLRSTISSNYKAILQLFEEYKKNETVKEIDVKILHKALLYGIRPRRIIQRIRLLNE